MIVMRPNATAFEEYVGYVQRRLHGREQLMYADQTGLMCYFGLDRTRTLPCSYLFDVANPLLSPGEARWKGNCLRLLGRHLRMRVERHPRWHLRTRMWRHLQRHLTMHLPLRQVTLERRL